MRYVRWILFACLAIAALLWLTPAPIRAGGMTVSPSWGDVGTVFQFSASGFNTNERVSLWLNFPDGSILAQNQISADASGNIAFSVASQSTWPVGSYLQVAHGISSDYEVTAYFSYGTYIPSSGSSGGTTTTGGCGNGNFSASGFTPNEAVATWTTRPDGQSVALANTVADSTGLVSFNFAPLSGWPVGPYIVVAYGRTSHYTGANNFNWDGANLIGGAGCATTTTGAPATQPVANPGLKQIVNFQGNAVYLNNIPDQLYYADCGTKWWAIRQGSPIYIVVVGFQPNEYVDIYTELFQTGGYARYGSQTADAGGVLPMTFTSTGYALGHYHLHFGGKNGSYYCGHFDLAALP